MSEQEQPRNRFIEHPDNVEMIDVGDSENLLTPEEQEATDEGEAALTPDDE